jgi:hypothetical protein
MFVSILKYYNKNLNLDIKKPMKNTQKKNNKFSIQKI